MAELIFQINRSPGGVPKLAVRDGLVTPTGLEGDRQRDLDHHGGPERALCLYSLERILALQQEGHPIFPGSVGENVTISGVEWSLMTPGSRWRLSEKVEIEITRFTSPCRTIAESFRDGLFSRIHQEKHPGWSRLYARVLVPGRIVTGAPVRNLS
jgi:MOSC domain-containing protein YiiM